MNLSDYANAATALTLVVATAALCLSLFERHARERTGQILKWQRVVVFDLIETGIVEYNEIKLHYLAFAQQFPEFKIPLAEIQDSALKVVLLSLLADKVISRTDEGTYVLNVVSLQENQLKNLAFAQVHKQMSTARLASKLYEFVDRESGKYTIDQLYRALDADELGFEFEDFNVHVRELVNRGVLLLDREQRVWARSKVPQQPPKQSPPPSVTG